MKVTPANARFLKRDMGEEFELNDKLARAFIRAGKLRQVEAKIVEAEPEEDFSPRTGRPRRQYRRRDLTAED